MMLMDDRGLPANSARSIARRQMERRRLLEDADYVWHRYCLGYYD